MIFLETEKLNLCAPSKDNVQQWTNWVNSSFARNTIFNLKTPKTVDMQWNWIQSELNSNKRILLEMCDKQNNEFLGVISLSCIDYEKRSAQIATLSPVKKNVKNKYCVYEARRAIVEYAFNHLSINKIYGAMIFPDNESFMVNNMCIGFEIEGIKHDNFWYNNKPKMSVCYFITKSIFEKKEIAAKDLNEQLTKENRDKNKKKLTDIIANLYVDTSNSKI